MDMQQIFNVVLGMLMSILSFIGKAFHSKLNSLEEKTFDYHAELSSYKTYVASTYMTASATNDNLKEIKERLIRMETKLDGLGHKQNHSS